MQRMRIHSIRVCCQLNPQIVIYQCKVCLEGKAKGSREIPMAIENAAISSKVLGTNGSQMLVCRRPYASREALCRRGFVSPVLPVQHHVY